MESLIIDQAALLESSFHSGSVTYDGLIYLMFSFEKGAVVPLYIGKTETLGKNQNLSEITIAITITHTSSFPSTNAINNITWTLNCS